MGPVDLTKNAWRLRCWLALHSLPRDERGQPPTVAGVEKTGHLAKGELWRLMWNSRDPDRTSNSKAQEISSALSVPHTWLWHGVGPAPTPTGYIPPLWGAVVDVGRDHIPERAEAAKYAVKHNWPPPIVEYMYSKPFSPNRCSVEDWLAIGYGFWMEQWALGALDQQPPRKSQ